MVVKLSRALLGQERTISLGYEIQFQFKGFTFADYKEAEAWAHRSARDGLTKEQTAALAGAELEELGDEFKDRLAGLAQEMLLDRLVSQFCTGWAGIEVYEGDDPEKSEPLPFNIENWTMVKAAMPMLLDRLFVQLQSPMAMVTLEGNGSAPSPNL